MKPLARGLALALLTSSGLAWSAEEGTAPAPTTGAPATEEKAPTAAGAAAPAGGAERPTKASDMAAMKTEKAEETAPAKTDEAPAPKPEDKEAGEEDTYGHGMQMGLRAGIAFGYKMYFRYERSPLCQKYDPNKPPNEQLKSCGFGSPPATEVALSFAPFDGVEPYIFARFGLSGEARTNTKALQLFGVGARIYTMSDSRFKIFLEPALAYETEDGAGNKDWAPPPGASTGSGGNPVNLTPQYKKDLIFHVGIGPQYDFAKAFGIYVDGGVDVGVLRAISANLHLMIGAQLRFP